MEDKRFNTPILFLIFNRPDTTAIVFQRIREIKPKYLYVSADGPRMNKPNEVELCEQARKIVTDNIDWDCELKTRFLEKNFGCKLAVSSGITWFFENVEEGIILEDDCLPDLTFFKFCETLLEYYRDNEKIMHISGDNFQDGRAWGTGSYYISTLNHVWGWATWRRAWNFYDARMSTYPQVRDTLERILPDPLTKNYWQKNFDLVYENKRDTWDTQWQYAMFLRKGLAIHPNVNLVSNIGFGDKATHTSYGFHTLANREIKQIQDIYHPNSFEPYLQADRYTYKKYLNPPKTKKAIQLICQIFWFIKTRLMHLLIYGTT